MFKIPTWKMLAYDGTAALLSVPLFVTAAYLFADQFDKVKELAKDTQIGVGVVAVLLVIGFVMFKVRRARRWRSAQRGEAAAAQPAPPAAARPAAKSARPAPLPAKSPHPPSRAARNPNL